MIIAATGFETHMMSLAPFEYGAAVSFVTTANTGDYAAKISPSPNTTDNLRLALNHTQTLACSVNAMVAASNSAICLNVIDTEGMKITARFDAYGVQIRRDDIVVATSQWGTVPDTYTSVEFYIIAQPTSGYAAIKVNGALALDYAGKTASSSGAGYVLFFVSSDGDWAYIDDLAIGDGLLGNLRIYPTTMYDATVSPNSAVEPSGCTVLSVLTDYDAETYLRIYYHAEVIPNSNETLSNAFMPGGCIGSAFTGSVPINSVFITLADGDLADGAFVAAGGNARAGDAYIIVNNSISNPQISYVDSYSSLLVSNAPAPRSKTVAYVVRMLKQDADTFTRPIVSIENASVKTVEYEQSETGSIAVGIIESDAFNEQQAHIVVKANWKNLTG